MIKFTSEELKERVQKAFKRMDELDIYHYWEYETEFENDELVEKSEEIFVIDYDTNIAIALPRTESDGDDMTLLEWLNMLDRAEQGINKEYYKFVSSKEVLYRVNVVSAERFDLIDSRYTNKAFDVTLDRDGIEYYIEICMNTTSFGVRLVIDDDYSKYLPPILDEYFVSIKSNREFTEAIADELFNAYIFELYCTFQIELEKSYRPEFEFWDHQVEEIDYELPRMRPMKFGKGLNELYQLFNSTIGMANSEVRILYFSRIIEYVSQTVIKQDLINSTLNKLNTSDALMPNAEFVLELESLFNNNKSYSKDNEAFKITIKNCCDMLNIKQSSPRYLSKVCGITVDSSEQQINEAYEQLSKAISDTRNEIAHAKTNYKKKGMECPAEQQEQFGTMMKIIAEQIIRWFSRQSEDTRIV